MKKKTRPSPKKPVRKRKALVKPRGATPGQPIPITIDVAGREASPPERPYFGPPMGSVEMHSRLADGCTSLRANKRFDQIRFNKLKEYWDPSWPRAPFEEDLTLGQLCSIDLDTFLKKRSMNEGKVYQILAVIERAVGTKRREKK